MSDVRYSLAQTVGGKRGPLLDLAKDPSTAQKFIEAQSQMYDHVVSLNNSWLSTKKVRLKASLFMNAHRVGFAFIDKQAGQIRNLPVFLTNSIHVPPKSEDVLSMLEELCDLINDNQNLIDPVLLSAIFLWKFLWIHPFREGNGSVARLFSYAILQAGLGYNLPGAKTLPILLSLNRQEYYDALAEADDRFRSGIIDVCRLETLLKRLLEEQLSEYKFSPTV